MPTPFIHEPTGTVFSDISLLPKILIDGQELCELSESKKIAAGYYPALIDPVPSYDLLTQNVEMNVRIIKHNTYCEVKHVVVDKTDDELRREKLERLTALREQKHDLINEYRNEKEKRSPFMFKPAALPDPVAFDYNQEARDRINPAIALAQTLALRGTPVNTVITFWKLADNTVVDMTIDDFLNFSIAQAERSGQIHARANELKDELAAIVLDDREEAILANLINLIPVE